MSLSIFKLIYEKNNKVVQYVACICGTHSAWMGPIVHTHALGLTVHTHHSGPTLHTYPYKPIIPPDITSGTSPESGARRSNLVFFHPKFQKK
jgi:hypothetical protein